MPIHTVLSSAFLNFALLCFALLCFALLSHCSSLVHHPTVVVLVVVVAVIEPEENLNLSRVLPERAIARFSSPPRQYGSAESDTRAP